MIEFRNIYKSYGKLQVLSALDLHIKGSGIYAILGPNGSGKTTLIKSLLGMVIPDQGEILLEGQSISGAWEYRKKLSYLPQIANFPANLTVRELLEMAKDLRNAPAREGELCELFGLSSALDQKLSNLSGGTKQKVNLVLCFMFDSPLIILDEPTTGLDPVSLIELKKLIAREKEAQKTILITTHIMNLVEEIADEIIFLLEGKIYFQGGLSELLQKNKSKNLETAIAALLQNSHAAP